MTTPQTVAALKRSLVEGQKIEMVRYNGETPPERIAGIGIVKTVQGNAVTIERNGKESWLWFPKAGEFHPSIERAGHFEISSEGKYPITLEYRLIN